VPLTPLVVGAVVHVGAAAAASVGGACTGPQTVSALNQYCENLPGAAGGQTPGPGTPALSSSLPPRLIRSIAKRGGAPTASKLLRLPARGPRPTHALGSRPSVAVPAGHASAGSLVLPFLLILLAIGAAIVGAARARRRRDLRTA
jgi:hypothetical protein